ncbi:hypothetical protein AeMF1_010553 [Aphanomyces euteiches]|nr:hypothetical protein AeMF1_010553 [Aphanomyces euteiches]KAH9190718.1 hypothetical protein AeNC1_007304 [Aphanomyces euteiches]
MFERQVTSLLTHLLGNYVEPSCFRHDKVNVGVWSGYVVLQHLELQRKIYPDLGVAVVRGVLGQITIKIPWNRLVYDSVLVTIDDVYILLRNVNREDLVPPTAEMEQVLKKKLIEELYQAKLDTDNAAVDDSFLLRLRTKIIDNLEFHIRRIHIRFQDASSGDHPYTFGLTMESLHVQSTDSNWQPSYVDASTTKEPMIYKSFELNHLSLYLNPDCALHGHEFFDGAACSLDQFTEAFSRSIPQRIDLTRPPPTPQGETKHHYILKPVNASAHLKMKRDYNDNQPAVPNMDLQVLIDEVALQLEESQYCDLLFLRSAIKTSQQAKLYEKYHRYRPIKSVFEDPRAWWKYAIQCIKSDVEQKHSAWSWMGIRERRDDKKQYVTLWHTLQLANMPEHFLGEEQVRVLQAELDAIETRRSVEDILLFRYLADVEMKKQHPAEMKTSAAQVSTASSYSLWNLVRWSGADSTRKSETADDMERQELYRILGYDPMDKAIAAHEYSVISIQLNQGSITLLNDPETKFLRTSSQYNRSYNPQPFFTALFAQVQTDIINVADSNLKMELSLQVMELYDESMDGHCILKRRVPVSTLSVEITMLTPVFRMSYESNASTDEQMLKLFMEPLEIIYSPTAMCWMHLSTFSTAPEALGLWAEMEMQAVNEFVNFKARTEAKVEYAMANRIPIAVDVRIQAPVIILPALDGEMLHCARLILDLGHVHFRTERLSNLDVDVMSSTHSRSKNSSALLSSSNMFAKQLTDEAESGEGATRWKEEFYDKFTCGMSNLHVMLLPPSVPYSPELLMHSTTPFSLVDPFHINVTLRKSVLPLDATLYQLYIHADLPALSIHLSVGQYQHLSKVLAGFKKQETMQATTMPMKSPVFPFTPRQKDNTTEDYEETQSVMSDDTWFSVEYGSDAEEQTVQDRLSLLTTINQASEAPGPKSPPRLTFKVPERSKPRIVRKVLDRRVCVCTVTIPIIQIHLMKTEDEAAGRVTGLVEGIKLRFAKRTLSTALRLRLASLAIDDHAENLPTHHVLFSCSTTPAMPFTSILPKSIRKTSLRRKVAVMLPSVAAEEAVDLLDINLTSEANEASQLDMTFGHLHVQFDQSRIAALVMQIMPLLHEEDDPMESIPPLSLEDAIHEIPISLTESVRQDLEKARHSLLHQAKKEETTENRSSIYRIKLHVHSVSVCFSNHMENIMSMALLDARLQGTLAPSSVEFKGHLGNLHVIDLVSSDLLHMKRKDKRYMFQEVLGMSPPETNPPPPVLTVSMNQTLDKGRIQVTVQRIRCVLSTRFLLKTLHYVYEGNLMEVLSHSKRPPTPQHRPTPMTSTRDVFFSPALTFDTRQLQRPRPIPPPPSTSTTEWQIDLELHEPHIVVPLHKSPNQASLEVNHGIVLELGHIKASWNQAKTTFTTKNFTLRSLHDEFEFLRPLHVDLEVHQGKVRVHLSPMNFQLSEMHSAMLVETYFQGYMPLLLYHQPTSSTSSPTSTSSLHMSLMCDGIGLSLLSVHSDLDCFESEELAQGLVFDMFMLQPYDLTPIASLTLEGIKLGVKKDQNTAVDLSIAQIALQNTVISPGSKVQYRHNIDKSTHSLWFESQAFRVAVDAPFLTRMVVVCLEAMSNVEHAMARHQNQAVSELASSVYDDVSEYQWTERGRSNSIASSIHMTATAPTPVVWNFDVSCKLVQVECGPLVLAAQVACKKDQNQLYMKLQQVLVQTAQSTLLHPVEIVLRHYSQSSMDPSIERNLSPYHSHVPDTLLFSSVQCTPLTVSFHLQDVDVVVDSISKLTTLAKSLDRIHQQLRPVTVEGLQHAMSIGDNVVILDGLDYSLQLLNDTNPPPTKPWQHVCIDLPSITVSVEAYSASVLSLNIEPSEFEWIGTPQVLSMTWKWQLDATYLNNRLLEMEPLLESMTMHLKLWQIIDATPLQIKLKSVDEMKLNCTFALLETCRLLSRMTLEKELASIVIKNETGVTFKVWTLSGPKEMVPGQEHPLQPTSTIHIRFPEYKQLEIPTSEVGTRTYRLPSTTLGSAVNCVIDISVERGCKFVVVQSTWLMQNKTSTPLQIQLVFPTGGIIPRPPYHCSLQPLESHAIPMSMVSFRGTRIYVKPNGVQTWTLVDQHAIHCDSSFVLYTSWDETNRRVLSFCAPLVLYNVMPTEMDFRLASAPGKFESGKLGVGEKFIYHGSEHDSLTLEIRTKGFSWSQATEMISGTISMIDPTNHSVLLVHVDVDTSKSGQWESGLELEYQHELAMLGPEHINPFAAGQAMPCKDEPADRPPSPHAVKRKHQLLPSIPPNRGLLDLIPKKVSIASTDAPLLAVCHTHQRQGILKIQLRLKGKGSAWSNVISCHISGANGECTIQENGRAYVVGFVLEHGQGWYDRTQVLTLVPRFLLINALDEYALDILLDETSSASATLEKSAQMPWHFTHSQQKHTIRIRFAAPGWVWSGSFNLHSTGDQTLRLRNTMDRTSYLIRISIKLEGPQYRIVFRSSTNVPPYRIENFSLETIRIHQSRVRISDILLPHQTCEYTWDEPLKLHLLVVDMLPSQADDNSRPIRIGVFSMDEITQFPTKSLAVEVRADGPTRVLRLTDFTPFPKLAAKREATMGATLDLVAPVVDLQVKLHSFSVSLVDSKPSELLYISWNTLGFQATWTKEMAHLSLHASVHSMQIDNQVRTTRYPVLLNFTESPALQATVVRETTYSSIEFLRYVNVELQPMRWRIDGALINSLASMFASHMNVEKTKEPTTKDRLRDFEASTRGLLDLPTEKTMSKKLYFEKFELAPIQATLSYATSSDPTNDVQVAGVRQILQAAGRTLTKIHNAPLNWRALKWQHMFVPRETMLNQMSLHYQHEAYRQAYLLLGSVDVLGNPVKVWYNLRGGLAAFVWEPLRGWQESPQAFGIGLVKGTTLLFRALVYAVLDFNTRIASSILLGLTDACQRVDTYTGYPVAKTLYQDIAQGASGVVVSPMHAYDLQGWSGLVPGVLAGLIGLVIKPLRGITQSVVNTTTILRDGIQYDTQSYVMRTRPPRYIDPRTHLLTSYSYVHSSGEDIKYNIAQARHEDYIGHVMSPERSQCWLVTKHRVLHLHVHTHPHHSATYTVRWEILCDELIVVAYVSPEKIKLFHKPHDITDLTVPTQLIEFPPTQALSVYYMLQQMTSTIANQASNAPLHVHFVDKSIKN